MHAPDTPENKRKQSKTKNHYIKSSEIKAVTLTENALYCDNKTSSIWDFLILGKLPLLLFLKQITWLKSQAYSSKPHSWFLSFKSKASANLTKWYSFLLIPLLTVFLLQLIKSVTCSTFEFNLHGNCNNNYISSSG